MKENIKKMCFVLTMVLALTGCGSATGTSSGTDDAVQIESTTEGMAADSQEDSIADAASDSQNSENNAVTDTADSSESTYREEDLELPDDSTQIFAMREIDGTLWLITENGVYTSADKGDSWARQEEQSGWLPEEISGGDGYASISDSGKLAFYTESAGILVYSTDGSSTGLSITFDDGRQCYGINFADDDTLTVRDTSSTIYILSVSDGSIVGTIPYSNEMHYSYAPVNGAILTITNDGVKIYNYKGELQEGNEIISSLVSADYEAWSTTSSGGGIVDGTEGTGIFYASKSGLYHYKWGGGVAEKLFEGSAAKLGDSDYTVWSIAALSDSCVLCHYLTASGASLLVRYSFSGNSPTTQKLTLYTLYENELLTDEVNTFNQNHTDIQVTIEVGLSGDSGLTVDDAIKTLNTEILAGNGPDLILLDGMSVDSYSESGMLVDLSGVLSEVAESEGLYENIAYTYQEETPPRSASAASRASDAENASRFAGAESGAVYAVPARFRIMMMVGTQENLNQITDLDSLCQSVQEWKEANPEMISILGLYDEELLEMMTAICSPAWMTEEGSLDETALREFLEAVKSINDTQKENVSQADIDEFAVSDDDNDWGEIKAVLNITNFQSQIIGLFESRALNTTASIAQYLGTDLVYESAAVQSSNVFIPAQIIGINAKSTNQEAALEFVKEFLSAECQSELSVSDRGYPINKTAFQIMKEDVLGADDTGETSWGVSAEDLRNLFDQIEAMIPELSNRSVTDAVITDSVKEEGLKYLSGEADLDTVVGSIMQTVTLHLAE
ncbi:MAG: extracellular solute-binding protein [Clostridiales bacterium]|nr:extracellular solute-binding protein [Clostridiales bacterium]